MQTQSQTSIDAAQIATELRSSASASPVLHSDSEKLIRDLTERLEALERKVASVPKPDSMNLLVFDGSRDRLLAAFVMATGAAACGFDVNMFFTFWGTSALRKESPQFGKKNLVERAFGWMLPKGLRAAKLSQMDMCGVGRAMMQREMRNKNVADLDELIETAADLNVKISVCEMSMRLMGIRREELIEYPDMSYCGVATFADMAASANTTLFI